MYPFSSTDTPLQDTKIRLKRGSIWIRNGKDVLLPWKFELPRICAFRAESRQDFTIDIENLNTVVIGIGYNNSVCIAYSNVMRMFQVTRFTSHYTEFAHEWAVRLENLKNKVFLKIRETADLMIWALMKINTMKIFPEFIKDSFASDIFIFIQYSYFLLRTYFA